MGVTSVGEVKPVTEEVKVGEFPYLLIELKGDSGDGGITGSITTENIFGDDENEEYLNQVLLNLLGVG